MIEEAPGGYAFLALWKLMTEKQESSWLAQKKIRVFPLQSGRELGPSSAELETTL